MLHKNMFLIQIVTKDDVWDIIKSLSKFQSAWSAIERTQLIKKLKVSRLFKKWMGEVVLKNEIG
jgi:hypothetical protein